MSPIKKIAQTLNEASLRAKLILLILATTMTSLIFASAVILTYETARARQVSLQDTQMLAKITADASTAALLFRDQKALNEYLASLNRRSNVLSACIYDAKGSIYGTFSRPGSSISCPPQPGPDGYTVQEDALLTIFDPIEFENQRIGTIFVASNQAYLKSELRFHVTLIGTVLIAAVILALLLSDRTQKYVSGPILNLANTALTVSKKKDFSIRADVNRHDELGILMEAFNLMLEEIQRLLRESQQAIQLRDEFMSIASHELKTPLTPLRAQVQMLQRLSKAGTLAQYPPEKLEKLMNFTDSQVTRLVELIEDLLDVTRITSGKLQIRIGRVHLSALIREVLERYDAEIRRSGSKIETSLDESIIAQWDRLRIEQILINLLTNALKYGQGKEIFIATRIQEDQVIISVQDHGIGITAEDQARIFNRFERAVPVSHFGGLGLGLYIATQIARAHGGNIRVESQIGQGSTFIVELPRIFGIG